MDFLSSYYFPDARDDQCIDGKMLQVVLIDFRVARTFSVTFEGADVDFFELKKGGKDSFITTLQGVHNKRSVVTRCILRILCEKWRWLLGDYLSTDVTL